MRVGISEEFVRIIVGRLSYYYAYLYAMQPRRLGNVGITRLEEAIESSMSLPDVNRFGPSKFI